ncbi:hypothetical protein Tco_0004410 [Tanacetum coccineum]
MITSCHSLKGSWSSISGRSLKFFSKELLQNNRHSMKKLLSLMLTSRPTLKDIMTKMGDLLNALNGVTETLKAIHDHVKEDHVLNKKVIEATKAYTKNSTHLTELLTLIKNFDFQGLKSSVESLQARHFRYQIYDDRDLLGLQRETQDMETQETDKDKVEKEQVSEEPKCAVPISSVKPNVTPEEDHIKKAEEEAKRLAMTKTEVIKIVQEEAENIGIDPKKVISAKAGEKFKKAQDAEMQVHKRQYTEKVKRVTSVNKKRAKQYIWTISSRLNPGPITDVKIHPNSRPAVLTVYRNNDKRNFNVHNPFKFADFAITELDKLALPAHIPEQASSQSSRRKRKHMELEHEIKVPGLECNRILPEGVLFVNNMVIKEPEYEIFFTDVFGDQAFQRWNDIHKVGVDSLVSYLVMASMIKTLENARFYLKLKKLIAKHLDQEKLQSKRVKLEAVGYMLD